MTIESGLSNFHVMLVTALKGGFPKRGPKIINYRDYNKFNNSAFKVELMGECASSKGIIQNNNRKVHNRILLAIQTFSPFAHAL